MSLRIGLWLVKLGLICFVLAYEQVLSIPYLTIVITILLVQNQTQLGRQALVVASGLVLATVYVLPLGVGILVMWGGAHGWKLAEHILKPDAPRLLSLSLFLALGVGLTSGVSWSSLSLFFLAFNGLISFLLVRFLAISTTKLVKENYG